MEDLLPNSLNALLGVFVIFFSSLPVNLGFLHLDLGIFPQK